LAQPTLGSDYISGQIQVFDIFRKSQIHIDVELSAIFMHIVDIYFTGRGLKIDDSDGFTKPYPKVWFGWFAKPHPQWTHVP